MKAEIENWLMTIQQEIGVAEYAAQIREGKWCSCSLFCFWNKAFNEIKISGDKEPEVALIGDGLPQEEVKNSGKKIVVLDADTVSTGDIPLELLKEYGDLTLYNNSTPDQVLPRCKGAQIILTNKVVITRELMEKLPDLKYVGVLATGFNIVDTQAARELGIIVANIPSYSTDSVLQMTWAHILNLLSEGKVLDSQQLNSIIKEKVQGKTIGIIGLGAIGGKVAEVAQELGMKVLVKTSRTDIPATVTAVSLETLLAESDIISLHCPLRSDNRELINADTLSRMKPTALLINTGRGGLVNEKDLALALNCGKIAGYGADVLTVEPAQPSNPLLSARNCYLTPHIAWATIQARRRLILICLANIKAFLAGKPVNVVNK